MRWDLTSMVWRHVSVQMPPHGVLVATFDKDGHERFKKLCGPEDNLVFRPGTQKPLEDICWWRPLTDEEQARVVCLEEEFNDL